MKKKASSKKRKPVARKKSAVKASRAEIRIGDQVWPLEKDVLFRPDRFKYVRKLIKPSGCVFCEAANNKPSPDTLCVYKTKHAMVMLNKFPYNSGHLLVLPVRHCGDLLKLSAEEANAVNETVRLAMRALNAVYEPAGMNLGMNHGATGGAGIPDHLHYHIVPRWAGDLNFFPLIAETKVVIESLEDSWSRLSQWFETSAGGAA